MRDERFRDVELEVGERRTTHGDGEIVSDHLRARLHERFARVGFTLPGMMLLRVAGNRARRVRRAVPNRGVVCRSQSSTVRWRSFLIIQTARIARRARRELRIYSALTKEDRDGGNLRRHASPNPGGEFNPVPTAVPPMASSSK